MENKNPSSGKKSKDDDFVKLQKLGSGSFGVVYTVKRKQDGKIYVMKVIDTTHMSNTQKNEACGEAKILA
jgi:serine/threonine protein kinase